MRETVAFISKSLAPFRRTIVFCTLVALFAAALDSVAPLLLGMAIDSANARRTYDVMAFGVGAWFLARTVAERLRTWLAYRGSLIAQDASSRWLLATGFEFLRKPLAFHYGKKSATISEQAGQVRWGLSNVIVGIVFDLAPAFLTLAVMMALIASIDWRVALSLLGGVVAFVAYSWKQTPKVIKAHGRWEKTNSDISGAAWDALRNILIVKSTANEAFVEKKVEELRTHFLDAVEGDAALDRRISDDQNLIIAVSSFVAILLAVGGLLHARLTFGQVTAIIAYTFAVFGFVKYGIWQFRSLLRLSAGYAIVKTLTDEPSEDFVSGKDISITGDVAFDNVRFRYREDRPILEDVTFFVRAGERVAIVGESGEGKTTLVDLLGRYYGPQSGQVLIDGTDVSDLNLLSLRSQMAYVPQDITLFHESLDFNIRYGRPSASDEDVREAVRQAHLADFVAALPEGLATVVGERGLKLSGGERQRVSLARAFLRDPKILVLDEPTSNLDSKTEAAIQESLDSLMKGRTTFIIAHRLRTVRDADRILVLKEGRIAEQGTHAELAAKDGAYAALLRAQAGFISPSEKHL